MRTLLTLLGVVIGVAAVIGMVSIGDGAKTIIMEDSEKIGGATMIRYRRARHIFVNNRWVRNNSEENFDYDDALAIEEQCPSVKFVIPSIDQRWGIRLSSGAGLNMRDMYSGYQAVTPDFQKAMKWTSETGRFISDSDVEYATSVCVLGKAVATELYGEEDPIGQEIRIQGKRFAVIGVMQERGRSLRFGFNLDETVFIPITTAQQRFTGNNYINSLSVQAKSIDHVPKAMAEVTELLKSRHRGEQFFDTRDVASGLDLVLKINKIIKILLTGVAGFSLIIGGIGIMNIMLVSVAERTREIGLRKAIGARPRDILIQFLIEAVMLTGIGGIMGVLMGLSVIRFVIGGLKLTTPVYSVLWIVISFGISLSVGVVFGMFPAYKAARLNPIEALRFE